MDQRIQPKKPARRRATTKPAPAGRAPRARSAEPAPVAMLQRDSEAPHVYETHASPTQQAKAAAEILSISQGPVATAVAQAPHGTWEDSTVAPLPADYPYPARMRRAEYETLKQELQIELLKVQSWVKSTGQRMMLLFEGRDAAGKGGTIKRMMEH